MNHKELVAQLAVTSEPEKREELMAQYIVSLEQYNTQLKKELAKYSNIAYLQHEKERQ